MDVKAKDESKQEDDANDVKPELRFARDMIWEAFVKVPIAMS